MLKTYLPWLFAGLSSSVAAQTGNQPADTSSINKRIFKLGEVQVSLEGGLNNVFDRNYAISEGYPEAGRNLFLNLVFNNL